MHQRGFHIGGYRVTSRLGAGGMGEVWLAEGRAGPVVLKTMLPELMDQPRLVELFLKEARIAALVQSPHVVRLLEVGREGACTFLVLEYVRGLSLARLLSLYGGPLPPEFAVRLAAQVALGLADIHAQVDEAGRPLGIVHRDISPSNVLLSDRGDVKVTDFGIAKIRETTLQSATTQGSVKGKLAFMSPEQARGEPVGTASDVYSLGVVLFRLLTGELPYEEGSELGLLQAVAAGQARRLCEVDPHLPEALGKAVDRTLSARPDDRPRSALELRRDLLRALPEADSPEAEAHLRAWAEGLTAQAREQGTLFRPEPGGTAFSGGGDVARRSRLPRWAGAAAGAALLVVGALVVVSLFGARVFRPGRPAPAAVIPAPRPAPPAAWTVPTAPRASPLPPAPAALPGLARPSSTPAVPTARHIRLETVPPCEVFVGEVHLGRAPVVLPLRPQGTAVRLVSRALGISYEKLITLPAGIQRARVEVPRGTLHVRIDPYSEATLDGTPLGEGPFAVLPVYAGQHELQVVNRELNIKRRVHVDVAPGEHKVFRLKLQ